MFVQTGDGRPTAKLLFDAEKVMAVHGADGKHAFEADKDFQVAPDGSGLLLPAASRIPFRKHSDLFPPKGSPNSIGHQAGQPATSLLFGEGHVFHDQQIEVTYVPRKEAKWTGYRPAFAGKRLPATLDKLRNKKALTIAVSGDSISQGYNASGLTKAPPFMPAYPNLVAAQLEKTYRAKVDLHNRAIAGWSVGQGVKDLDNLLKSKPDLVIIAYGMNDVGGRNPDGFKANIATMLRRIKEANAATEVILVASMMGNPDWAATPPEMFPRYRDALASLEGPGVVLADLTAVWQKLLERKRFVDMTGNGVNHPNDYGHRLYAQAILALLVPPDLVRGDPPSKPTRHVEQLIEGWTVHVEDRLLMGPDAEVGKRAIQILTMRLVDIKIAVPADKVARLQKVPIWLDRTHGKLKPAQYHPSIRWPKTNGYDEALVKCVHIPDAAEFASPGHQRVQPWSVLHELAHAYHDQVLGFDHAEIAAAWKQFKDSGRYEKVLHINGSTTRH
jgi:lysophospholipase L1-like esterase